MAEEDRHYSHQGMFLLTYFLQPDRNFYLPQQFILIPQAIGSSSVFMIYLWKHSHKHT